MATAPPQQHRGRALLSVALSTRVAALPTDIALVAVRTASRLDLHLVRGWEALRCFQRTGATSNSALLFEHRPSSPRRFLRGTRGCDRVRWRHFAHSRTRGSPRWTCFVRRHGDGDDHRHLGERHQLGVAHPRLRAERGALCVGSGRGSIRRRSSQHRCPRRATRWGSGDITCRVIVTLFFLAVGSRGRTCRLLSAPRLGEMALSQLSDLARDARRYSEAIQSAKVPR